MRSNDGARGWREGRSACWSGPPRRVSRQERLRFTGREVDRYDTGESRHVLYECGPGRYRILVSRFDDGSEIYPEPEMGDESSSISYGYLTTEQAATRWPHKEYFAGYFPVEDIDV